jgi:prepilin-type N-terminal cleavage/methylation domain-containing protein
MRGSDKNNRKGFTMIELVITMAIMAIIGVAIIGISMYIVRYYQEVSDRTHARNVAMTTMDYIRAELVDAKEVEVFFTPGSITSSETIDSNETAAVLTSEGSNEFSRYPITQSGGNHIWGARVAAYPQIAGEGGNADIWQTRVTYYMPGTEPEPIVGIRIEMLKSGNLIDTWESEIYLPNVQINDYVFYKIKFETEVENGTQEGLYMFYIKGLVTS